MNLIDLDRSLRLISRELAGEAYSLYVVDASLQVVLHGRSVADIAPPEPGIELPPDVAAALAMLAHDHDFERERIAGAFTNARRQIRVVRLSGPAGSFFGVMSAEPIEESAF